LRLLNRFGNDTLCFNDDIEGTAASTLGGILAALRVVGGTLAHQRFLIAGAGETGSAIAELIALAVAKLRAITLFEARKQVWLVDSHGLVVRSRGQHLSAHKLPWAHKGDSCQDLLSSVQYVKPTALIGVRRHSHSFKRGALSSEPGVKLFSRSVLTTMARLNSRPIVFALSKPVQNSECTAEEAYLWTEGRCVFSSGCSYSPVRVADGRFMYPSTNTSALIFPGIALGCLFATATRLRHEMFLAAADALSQQVGDEDLAKGSLYPRISRAREVSISVAQAVANKVYAMRLANTPPPGLHQDTGRLIRSTMYQPTYRSYS